MADENEAIGEDGALILERDARGHFIIPEEVKRRIVMEFACSRTSGEIKKMLEDEYGITHIAQRNLFRYDASKDYSCCSPELKRLYEVTRKEFVEGSIGVHISNMSYRLRMLQRLAEKAEALGTVAGLQLAAEIIEQGAKDVGGIFTNVRQVQGDFTHKVMSPDEARARVEALKKKQIEGRTIQ